MTQSLSQSFLQQMRMEQRLTPQLIQSMAILQKPITDLEAYINEVLETNAALELADSAPEGRSSTDNSKSPAKADERVDAEFSRLARYAKDYGSDLDFYDRAPHLARRLMDTQRRDPKLGALANTQGREETLNEFLLSQWSLVDVSDEVRRAGEAIINYLDPDGYLRVVLGAIADKVPSPPSEESLQTALVELHKLDPPGIAARNVEECLLLQLDRLPGDNQMERTLIKHHLDDLAHNRLPVIARKTGYSLGEINEAIKAMRSSLCLHPGFLVGDRSVPAIRPDVIVEYAETGGGLTVRLTRGNMPQLRINDEVSRIAKSDGKHKEARDFARKQIEQATSIIDAVSFRQSRLMEVAKAIVIKQRDFFDVGPEGLKVWRMSELAEELGCDPSTISRTVADKCMQTPRGIYPMRYFFTGGTETEDGESMGWDRVKTRVNELVDAEDRTQPLNDDQIAERLKDEGINISRRTVAKYRQQLDIPTARQRKMFD